MSQLRRRTLMIAALALGAWPLSTAVKLGQTSRQQDKYRRALEHAFSAKIANAPETEAFIDAFSAIFANSPDHAVVWHFITASNVLVHLETGEPLFFNEIYLPHHHACSNMLGAMWAHETEHL